MDDQITEAAIANLERGIEEYEQKIRALRTAINTLCETAGMSLRYAEAALTGGSASRLSKIQGDTFYGKRQTPAMREYLEMRKAQGIGPAAPREIFEALKAGGYVFEAKDETVALVGLRALLRTQPQVFHRLPQGTYGLTSWYPDAPKHSADDGPARKGKRSKRKRAAAKRASAKHDVAATGENVVDLKAQADEAA